MGIITFIPTLLKALPFHWLRFLFQSRSCDLYPTRGSLISLRHHQTTETEGYTNDLKIDLKGYDRLYLFYYSIEMIQI